ncbi:putative peptide zinc metalloprotease protein [Clostridium sp. DSM 8431]|uniref:hypothetical protein n=1 Tax=Clostridium sp. DSM 8431 TaxID=1761781 RepID=UPI0008E7AEA0|nr:hypothetical protein [Clostridium sp. DSM 8431]SFU85011.1 putative peptide zinc metalloprotease protein [Clostridium sp. DSM 8431]
MYYQKFEDDKYEMLKSDNVIAVKDKTLNKYYEAEYSELFKNIKWKKYLSRVSKTFFIVYLLVLLSLLIVNLMFLFICPTFSINNKLLFIGISFAYTLINVIAHEGAHIIALKVFGKKVDKVGMKMNYIFPSIYVRMNDVYMLSREEKVIVHSAGIFANVIVNGGILIFTYIFKLNMILAVSQFFVLGIIMNVVPVLNSDGYKVMLAMFMYNEKKDKIYNSKFIEMIGYGNIILSAIYFVKLIIDIL